MNFLIHREIDVCDDLEAIFDEIINLWRLNYLFYVVFCKYEFRKVN